MNDLTILFQSVAQLANKFDGAENSYRAFMQAAIAYEQAGGTPHNIDTLLEISIRAADRIFAASDDASFMAALTAGGSQIVRHGSVFVKPTAIAAPPGMDRGATPFEIQPFEPKLQATVQSLRRRGIYFDDLVLDVGSRAETQMRTYPYVIITIPRLNAQIAVSNQRGQAVFVAQPAVPLMDWAVFDKQRAGVPGTPFSHVKRIVCSGKWEEKMLDWVFGTAQAAGAKISLPGYVRAHRTTPYPLSESMIVAMAKLYRARHPERQWPAIGSGRVDQDIVTAVTGDPDWQRETWQNINTAAAQNLRGLKNSESLARILRKHGCAYDLTEDMIIAMAIAWRARHPEHKWPSLTSGEIPRDIVTAVTGDPLWQTETWLALNAAGAKAGRGLPRKTSLSQILRPQRALYDLSDAAVLEMARLYRDRHPDKQWPNAATGPIPAEIVSAVTGIADWPIESWGAIDHACRKSRRGLAGAMTLAQLLRINGCHYDQLSEEKIVEMALLWRARDPLGRLPSKISGAIPQNIVTHVMGDPHWQAENWANINAVCKHAGRGLRQKTSLRQIFEKHLPALVQPILRDPSRRSTPGCP